MKELGVEVYCRTACVHCKRETESCRARLHNLKSRCALHRSTMFVVLPRRRGSGKGGQRAAAVPRTETAGSPRPGVCKLAGGPIQSTVPTFSLLSSPTPLVICRMVEEERLRREGEGSPG